MTAAYAVTSRWTPAEVFVLVESTRDRCANTELEIELQLTVR